MAIEDPRGVSARLGDTDSSQTSKLRAAESVTRARLGGGDDLSPEAWVPPAHEPHDPSPSELSLSEVDDGASQDSPLLRGLSAFFSGPAETEAASTRASGGVRPLDSVLLLQPQMASALALGGVLAGCAVGAITLGLGGAILTFAFEAMAFAGGILVSRAGQKQLLEATEKLRYDATHDAMTGLLNRKSIMDGLEEMSRRTSKAGGVFALLLTDVDHFKKINDTYGHQAGDDVLRAVAGRIRENVRAGVRCGRYGGEEFLLVLPETTSAMAYAAAERIRKVLAAGPIATGYGFIPVTVSIGVAATDRAGTDSTRLLRAADEALYRAKHDGRNRVEVALQPV